MVRRDAAEHIRDRYAGRDPGTRHSEAERDSDRPGCGPVLISGVLALPAGLVGIVCLFGAGLSDYGMLIGGVVLIVLGVGGLLLLLGRPAGRIIVSVVTVPIALVTLFAFIVAPRSWPVAPRIWTLAYCVAVAGLANTGSARRLLGSR